jgi:hypothetical protein
MAFSSEVDKGQRTGAVVKTIFTNTTLVVVIEEWLEELLNIQEVESSRELISTLASSSLAS